MKIEEIRKKLENECEESTPYSSFKEAILAAAALSPAYRGFRCKHCREFHIKHGKVDPAYMRRVVKELGFARILAENCEHLGGVYHHGISGPYKCFVCTAEVYRNR